MIISLCIPVMNRLTPLKEALPVIIKSANGSPPCEIVVLNYDSKDGLEDYLEEVKRTIPLTPGNVLLTPKVSNEKYYNSARARNCCVKASTGEYIIQLSAEALPVENYVAEMRKLIEEEHPAWMVENSHTFHEYKAYMGRFIVVERNEFINAGGFDERFNVYAPEDKDICMRLTRRGGKLVVYGSGMIKEIVTSDKDKLANLDTTTYTEHIWMKRQMAHRMQPIYLENNRLGVLVANEGKEWGVL